MLARVSLSKLEIACFAGLLLVWTVVWRYVIRIRRLPYRNLPGPKSSSLLWGNMQDVVKAGPGEIHHKWHEQYGPTIWYKGPLAQPRIHTTDPGALRFIMSHTNEFPKDDATRLGLAEILGRGLLFAEGADHTRQKRIINPAFAPAMIRDNYMPIFYAKAYELRDVFAKIMADSSSSESALVDVYQYLGKATLDVIGLAGFDYDFNTLKDPNNELAVAFNNLFKEGFSINVWVLALSLLPFGLGRKVPTRRNIATKVSLATTRRIGQRLIEQKKAAATDQGLNGAEKANRGRDLLSVIVRANMDPSIKESQRMTDEEVLGQITTFMLAGQETSSTALTWTLWKLSEKQDVQAKLREELLAVGDEQPTMDELSDLPYLDAVVRESLRLMAPVPATSRTASVDVEVPLQFPAKGRDGKTVESMKLPKGTTILVGILNANKDAGLWGSDSLEFNPSRWLDHKDPASTHVPGVWSSLMTFIGGPRACIGYRFAIIEIKVILFALLRSFVFEPSNPPVEIEGKTALVTRPTVKGKKGPSMPLTMRPVA